jgi:hypothetical protein
MAYFGGEAPRTGETIRLNPEETTLYERITEFEAKVQELAHDRGLSVNLFKIYDQQDRLEITVEFKATSAFLRKQVR